MTTGMAKDEKLEKQMGCMAGFLHLFDRHQILTGKRLYSTKRLPPATGVNGKSESEKTVGWPAISEELAKPQIPRPSPGPEGPKSSPLTELRSISPSSSVPLETPPKSPLPLPIFELKEGVRSSWKFCKEAPRLSLDSRATVDAKGSLKPKELRTNAAILSSNPGDLSGDETGTGCEEKQRRSTSVIARLMGLEPLPHSSPEPEKKAELRRSASESRVSRDIFQYRFADGNNLQQRQPYKSHYMTNANVLRENVAPENNGNGTTVRPLDPMKYYSKDSKLELPKAPNRNVAGHPWKSPQPRRVFFDSAEVFPEPKQTMTICGEIERRLRTRGIDEPSKDLETLKQILEALQLKGLLHSAKRPQQIIEHRNLVHDESPIVVMRPSKPQVSPINRRARNDCPPPSCRSKAALRTNPSMTGESLPSVSPRRDRNGADRSLQSPTRPGNASLPTRSESGVRRSNSPVKGKPLSVETQRRTCDSTEQRRVSPVQSPKLNCRRNAPDQAAASRSPRSRKPTASIHPKGTASTEDESSESAVSTSSQTDTEKSKVEESKESRNILERCDKLLHSIAEMNSSDMQPSPVSVLDSSFYKDESSSPSPVLKRSIDFEDHPIELDEEIWSPAVFGGESKLEESSEDCDFEYISDILRASNYLPDDSDVFLLLEKQHYLKGKDTSKASRLDRKLIFDTIAEILDRNRQLPPWKVFSRANNADSTNSFHQSIWFEFQRIRERDTASTAEDDLFDIICGMLRKDLADDTVNGWGDRPVEVSETVLDIERRIFKDLVVETIRDLAALACRSQCSASRKKLFF